MRKKLDSWNTMLRLIRPHFNFNVLQKKKKKTATATWLQWNYPNLKWNMHTHVETKPNYNKLTAQNWCFDQWALSSVSPSHCADRPLWSETSAAPVLTAGCPAERKMEERCYHSAGVCYKQGTEKCCSYKIYWNDRNIMFWVLSLTTVSSLIFFFKAGLSSFTVMVLYFSSI